MVVHHIIAMKRSGQHGVIHWLGCQYQDSGYTVITRNNTGMNLLRRLKSQLEWWLPPGWALTKAAPTVSDKKVVLNNYEDEALVDVLPQLVAYSTCQPFSGYQHRYWVVLRDPFNCFASRFRCQAVKQWVPLSRMRALWVDHALPNYPGKWGRRSFRRRVRACQAGLSQVELRVAAQPPAVRQVLFNAWFSERAYRETLAQELGLICTDRGREEVGKYGSSFDAQAYAGKASQMAVLDRWRAYRDDKEYREQFSPEIVRLSEALFGRLPAVAELSL